MKKCHLKMLLKEDIDDCISRKPHLKTSKRSLKGLSGNYWTPDIIIEDTSKAADEERVKVIFECKAMGTEIKVQTYREHMLRAYAELGDLRNWKVPKYLVVTYIPNTRFDYDAYFKSIGVERISAETWNYKKWILDTICKV